MWNENDFLDYFRRSFSFFKPSIMSVEEGKPGEEGEIITSIKPKIKIPSRYKVLLHNDDYTTMEFVIEVLQNVFGKNLSEANEIMIKVHEQGSGVCGIYSFEIAETKANQAMRLAKTAGHPLKSSIEME